MSLPNPLSVVRAWWARSPVGEAVTCVLFYGYAMADHAWHSLMKN